VSVLGSEQAAADTLAGLKSAAGFIRSELAHSVNLRITPELKFVLDESMAYGAHIDKVLEDLHLSEQAETEED
jgi:ribosome-binding factor A